MAAQKKSWWGHIFGLPTERGSDAWGLSLIKIFLVLSFFVLLIIGISVKWGNILVVLGLSLSIAFAALFTGGIIGFLFGIPRRLQAANSTTASPNDKYTDNTNLEEISDWLTKIIVGVTLVQLPAIEAKLNTLCLNLEKSFGSSFGKDSGGFAYTYSGAIIIFYFLCGFLAVYLWARTYLTETLSDKYKTVLKQALRKQELQNILKDFQKTIQRISSQENNDSFKTEIDKAKPEIATVCEDCQKNRWGGKTEDDLFSINASVTKANALNMKADVVLTLVEKQAGQLATVAKVMYLLHDSYLPEMIRVASDVNNGFECKFSAYEAFTLGVIVVFTDPNTPVRKYEVDLNTLANLPEGFNYTRELMTIGEVEKELATLEG